MKSIIIATVALSYSTFSSAAQVADGNYKIVGRSTVLGEYIGEGWVKDGVAQRKVRYNTYKYRGDDVESIWSGVSGKNGLDFSLTLSNVLTSVESFAPESFDSVSVSLLEKDISKEASFRTDAEGVSSEQWTRVNSASDAPLWKDLRVVSSSEGDKHFFIDKLAKLVGLNKVIDIYRGLPETKVYEERPEFKGAKQYFVKDKTDADFYLNNPKVLRLTNKTVNPLALVEATMRKNAYGHSLAWKADYLGNQTIKNNLNEAGFLELAVVDTNGKKIDRKTEYDTALWTGMFGWAELLRYQNTKDPKALANFKKVLDGILSLVEVTGNEKEFARGLAISHPQENLGEGWLQGEGKFSHLKWRKGGNNDMIKGIFMTLTLAHQVVQPSESELIARIQKVAQKLSDQEVASSGFNHGIAKGLDALWNKNEDSFEDYHRSLLNIVSAIGDVSGLGAGVYIGGIADWSGINLTMVSSMSQILLSKELQKVFPYDKLGYKAGQVQKAGEARLYKMHRIYRNAHRDFLTLMTYAYSPEARKEEGFSEKAREAVWTLKEVPAPRNFIAAKADLKKQPLWSASAWPRLPWKALKGFRSYKDEVDSIVLGLTQGAYSYPHFEAGALDTVFFWKDIPFYVKYESDPTIQKFSADYMLMYWVSRSAGLITADE